MKRSVVAALGAVVIATLGAANSAQAAMIDFGVAVADGAVTYVGASLDQSTLFDLDGATLLVTEIASGDSSGLALFDPVMLTAATDPVSSEIIYGSGTGPGPLGADVALTWPLGAGPGVDVFTERLTTVESVNRAIANEVVLTLSGTVSDTSHVFTDSPVVLILSATQAGGPGQSIVASFSNTSRVSAVPEVSTWAMMALGFGALGFAAARRRKANIAMLTA